MLNALSSILQLHTTLVSEQADKSAIDSSASSTCANLDENQTCGVAIAYREQVEQMVHSQLYIALFDLSMAKSPTLNAIVAMTNIYEQGVPDIQTVTSSHPNNAQNRENTYTSGPQPSSMNHLSLPRLLQDAPLAAQLYRRAIDQHDHADSIFNLALLLQNGAPGV